MCMERDLQQGVFCHKLVTTIHLSSSTQEVDAFYEYEEPQDLSDQRDLRVNSRQDNLGESNQIQIRLTSNDCVLYTLRVKSGSNKDI